MSQAFEAAVAVASATSAVSAASTASASVQAHIDTAVAALSKVDFTSAFVGAVLGVVVAAWFQPYLERQKNLVFARVRRGWHFIVGPSSVQKPVNLRLGNRDFQYLIVDGDGELTHSPTTLRCVVDAHPLELPPDVAKLRADVEEKVQQRIAANLPAPWNGPQYALNRYVVSRTIPTEEMQLTLVLQKTDYFAFQATVLGLDVPLLDGATLRQRYLSSATPEPIPFLSIGLGVAIVILTSDWKILASRRGESARARPGRLDVSFVEGVHPDLDRAAEGTAPDLYRTVVRGAKEEVGVELRHKDIQLLGFGVDREYNQWNVIGVARISESAKDALDHRTRGVSGKWENTEFEAIDGSPEAVWRYLSSEDLWATGWVAVYLALVNEYGRSRVDRSARQYLN